MAKTKMDCADCGVNTVRVGHYYMVHNYVWAESDAGKGLLCLDCLEARLGRPLEAEDFTSAPVNADFFRRLRRMTRYSRLLGATADTDGAPSRTA